MQNGVTPLMQAAENGNTDCMRLLLEAGVDKNAKDNVRDWKTRPAALRVSSVAVSNFPRSQHLNLKYQYLIVVPIFVDSPHWSVWDGRGAILIFRHILIEFNSCLKKIDYCLFCACL